MDRPVRECAIMRPPWKQLVCSVVLFSAVSSQEQTVVPAVQSSLDKTQFQVFLTASGKHDSPVTLDQSKLSVSVDGQPAQINTLRSAKNDVLLFAVVVDMSKSDSGSGDSIKKAALQIFQALSANGNQGYLALFNDRVAISDKPAQVSRVQKALDTARYGGGTAVFDAIQQTCTQKLSRAGNPDTPRRVIVLISDGDDNASQVTHTASEETAEKEGVAIFSLITESPFAERPRGAHVLKELSERTGGQAFGGKSPTAEVAPLLAAVEDQWALSFVPAQSLNPKLHVLAMKTAEKDIRISAPAHIFVP